MIISSLIKKLPALIMLLTVNNFSGVIKFCGKQSTLAVDQTHSSLKLDVSLDNFGGVLRVNSANGTAVISNATGAELINFTDGSISKQAAGSVEFSGGAYNPSTALLTLSTGQTLVASAGATIEPAIGVASGATASIVGTPVFGSPVSLTDSTSSLNLGLQNALNQSIVLNGGTLVLVDQLTVAENVQVSGPGTVDASFQAMKLNSGPWSSDLTFWRAQDLQLNGSVNLTGQWSFLTNGSDNVSVLNGNGNVLTFSGNGSIVVGNNTAGHTLYITDLTIKGLSGVPYVVPSLTHLQYYNLPGLSNTTLAEINVAYAANFVALSDGNSTLINYDAISVCDDPSLSGYPSPAGQPVGDPFVYGVTKQNVPGRTSLSSGPFGDATLDGSGHTDVDIDAGVDGSYGWIDNTNFLVKITGVPGSSNILSIRTTAESYQSIAIGDYNNIYVVRNADRTSVSKYTGDLTFGSQNLTHWNDTWATGYTSIVDIAASNDGSVWVVDNLGGGNYGLYRTNGGAKSGATSITLPESPTTYGTALQSRNAISIKGSTTSLYGAYCGGSGVIYTTSDGLNFTFLTSLGATGVAVGAQGSLAFTAASDSATPGFSSGLAVFVRPPQGNGFHLFDGGATDANRGKVIFSNVTIELAGNYTHSAGRMTFDNAGSTIVTGGNKTFNITSTNAPVQVDGTALVYETLSGSDTSPFANSPHSVTLLNSGLVRSSVAAATASAPVAASVDLVVDANANNGAIFGNTPLQQNYELVGNYSSHSGRIVVTNAANNANQTVTIDGGYYSWRFPALGNTPVFLIADDVVVTLQNVVLKDFSLNNFIFGGPNAGLVFGNGVIIELSSDQALTSGQQAWNFFGGATVKGSGQTITLSNNNAMSQNAPGSALTLQNVILKSGSVTSLSCTNSSASVSLSNSTLLVDQHGFNFPTGSLNIYGNSRIGCIRGDSVAGVAQFQFTTSGMLTITTGASLEIGRAIDFVYNPDTSGDVGGATGAPAKRHLLIGVSPDKSAVLYCNNCTIDATSVGIAFDHGNLIIANDVNLNGSTTTGHGSELGSALNVQVLAGGSLNLQGAVTYTLTT